MTAWQGLFLLGLMAGLGPCLVSCAPVVLPCVAGAKRNWLEGFGASVAFSLARGVAYVVLGMAVAVGPARAMASVSSATFALGVRLGTGVLLCALGALIVAGQLRSSRLCKLLHARGRTRGLASFVALGVLLGLAPCPPLIAALAIVSRSAVGWEAGALLGAAFAAGTLLSPLMPLAAAAAGAPSRLLNARVHQAFQQACGLLVVCMGLWTLVGGSLPTG